MSRKSNKLYRKRTKKPAHFADVLITVGVVIHNDQAIIAQQLKKIYRLLQQECKYFEILVIDNGSTDESREILFQLQKSVPNIRALILSRQYDPEIGVMAALENSIGDYVVLLDITSDPATLISKLIKRAQTGYDLVIAKARQPRNQTWLSRSLKKIAQPFQTPSIFSYQILSRPFVTVLTKLSQQNKLLHSYQKLPGFTQGYLSYSPTQSRKNGWSQNFLISFKNFLAAITTNSRLLLRLALSLGLFASFLNLTFLLYTFISTFIFKQPNQTFRDFNLINNGMFFLIFVILTVMTEYLSRAFVEPRKQPRYFVTEEFNSSVIAETNRINVV